MAVLVLRRPVGSRSVLHVVIGTAMAFAGVMVLARGVWLLAEAHYRVFFDSPAEFIFLGSIVVLQLGETIAFIMMNSERVESELKEAEAELRITVARLQEALAGQKLVEGSLRDREERLSYVLEGSREGFWDWNIETGEVNRNKRWGEMLGYFFGGCGFHRVSVEGPCASRGQRQGMAVPDRPSGGAHAAA